MNSAVGAGMDKWTYVGELACEWAARPLDEFRAEFPAGLLVEAASGPEFQDPGRTRAIRMAAGEALIGRADAADIVLTHGTIAPEHCLLVARAGEWAVRSLSSSPTRVNETQVSKTTTTPLPKGARLELGGVSLQILDPEDAHAFLRRIASGPRIRPISLSSLWTRLAAPAPSTGVHLGPYLVLEPKKLSEAAIFSLAGHSFVRVGRSGRCHARLPTGSAKRALELVRRDARWFQRTGDGYQELTSNRELQSSPWRCFFIDHAGLLRYGALVRLKALGVASKESLDAFLLELFRALSPIHHYPVEPFLARWRAQAPDRPFSEMLVSEGVTTPFGIAKVRTIRRGLLDIDEILSDVFVPCHAG